MTNNGIDTCFIWGYNNGYKIIIDHIQFLLIDMHINLKKEKDAK